MFPPFQFHARRRQLRWAMLALLGATSLQPALASDTSDRVRRLEHLVCGVVSEPADWNKDDVHGDLSPLAARLCDGIAAHLSAGGLTARIIRYSSEAEALDALEAGATDLAIGVTPGPAAEARHAVIGPVFFRDDLVFAARPASRIGSIAALDRRTVCFIDGTKVANLALETLAARSIHPIPFPFQEQGEMDAAVAGGRCSAVAGSVSRLTGFREQFGRLDFLQPPFGMVPATVATAQHDAAWTREIADAVEAVLACGRDIGLAATPATRPPAPSPCR